MSDHKSLTLVTASNATASSPRTTDPATSAITAPELEPLVAQHPVRAINPLDALDDIFVGPCFGDTDSVESPPSTAGASKACTSAETSPTMQEESSDSEDLDEKLRESDMHFTASSASVDIDDLKYVLSTPEGAESSINVPDESIVAESQPDDAPAPNGNERPCAQPADDEICAQEIETEAAITRPSATASGMPLNDHESVLATEAESVSSPMLLQVSEIAVLSEDVPPPHISTAAPIIPELTNAVTPAPDLVAEICSPSIDMLDSTCATATDLGPPPTVSSIAADEDADMTAADDNALDVNSSQHMPTPSPPFTDANIYDDSLVTAANESEADVHLSSLTEADSDRGLVDLLSGSPQPSQTIQNAETAASETPITVSIDPHMDEDQDVAIAYVDNTADETTPVGDSPEQPTEQEEHSIVDVPSSSPLPSSSPPELFSSSPLASSQSSADSEPNKFEKGTEVQKTILVPQATDITMTIELEAIERPASPPLPPSSPPEMFPSSPVSALPETRLRHAIDTPSILHVTEGRDPQSPTNARAPPTGVIDEVPRPGLDRARSPPDGGAPLPPPVPASESRAAKKRKVSEDADAAPAPPAPMRATPAAQTQQRKKLATPFRSPVIDRRRTASLVAAPAPAKPSSAPAPAPEPAAAPGVTSVATFAASAQRHRTVRAGGQFKAPFAAQAGPAVRPTPTLQALERRVQVLRRAVKVRGDGEEAALEELVRRWTTAGREVAWDVWDLVKDRGGEAVGAGEKRGFEGSWGWEEKAGKAARGEDGERNWGWHVAGDEDGREGEAEGEGKRVEEEVEEEERGADTLGTMLRQLGIAPETLGWSDEEGCFVGE